MDAGSVCVPCPQETQKALHCTIFVDTFNWYFGIFLLRLQCEHRAMKIALL
jgi:hypothetical protein